jgi:hypothetical protein
MESMIEPPFNMDLCTDEITVQVCLKKELGG